MEFYGLGIDGRHVWYVAHREGCGQLPWEEIHMGTSGLEEDPLEYELSLKAGGEKAGDLIWAGPHMTVVSPRVVGVLHSISATGFRVHPVLLKHPICHVAIYGYCGLLIHGSGGPLDAERSMPRYSPNSLRPKPIMLGCSGGYHIYKDRWDGSDLFRVAGLGSNVFVTTRVAEALAHVRPKLRGLSLRPNAAPT